MTVQEWMTQKDVEPLLDFGDYRFAPERVGGNGRHVLPDKIFDALPPWPLASNRPAGMSEEKALEPTSGMRNALYMTEPEAIEALRIALVSTGEIGP